MYLHCRFWAWKSKNDWGSVKLAVSGRSHIANSSQEPIGFSAITVGSSQEPTVKKWQYKKLPRSSLSCSLPSRVQKHVFGPLPPLLRLLFTMKLALGSWRMAWSFCFKVSSKYPLLWFCCLISVILMATLLHYHSSSFSILESARLPSKLWRIHHLKGWCLWTHFNF
jgi:hypothetical protein